MSPEADSLKNVVNRFDTSSDIGRRDVYHVEQEYGVVESLRGWRGMRQPGLVGQSRE